MRRGASFGAARGFGGRARRRSGGEWTRWVGRRGTAGARRGWFPRANGATLAGGRASPDTVLGAGASRGDRGSCAARTSRKNCLERAFASGRLAEKTGAPAGALRPWLVANRASELLSAMTMAAAPLCPVAFPSPPHARFARVWNGRRLSLARRPTVADVLEMRDDETARREWRPGAAGRAFSRARAAMMGPRRVPSQRTGEIADSSLARVRQLWRADRSWLPRRAFESTRARSSPFQRAREVRDRSRVMSGWASSPPQVRIPPPAASPSPPRRSSDPPSSRCFRLAASRFIPPPPLPRRDPAPDRALTPIHPVHARRRGTAAASPPGPPPTTAASASPTASPSPRTSPTPCRPTRAR